jgi:hypothetical protein
MVSHGYINTREMQSPFAIELSRRGYVVLSLDMAGHGDSGGALGTDDGGGPDALSYLASLPFVDRTRIGLEGHSMGGVPVVGAAMAQPNGYRSMVLEGSTTPEPGQLGAGTANFPRNLEVVFGRFDEFAPLMWHEPKGSMVGASPKMRALFGTQAPVEPGRLYGDIARGTARRLVNPPITHPWEHFSAAGVGAAIDWFQATLPGAANPRPASDQIWIWKEVGTLIGLVGFVAVVLGAFEALLATPAFASLQAPPATPAPASAGSGERSGGRLRWWIAFVLAAAVPALTYYPLMDAGFAFMPSRLFPEWVANQLVVWGVGSTLIGFVGYFARPRERTRLYSGGIKSAVLAVLCVGAGYAALALADVLFKVDFRFWVVGLKPLDGLHLVYALTYLPLFALVFIPMVRMLIANIASPNQGTVAQYAALILAPCLGFVVLLLAQYATLRTTGLLLSPKEALNTIIAIQFVPILAFVGLTAAFTWRRSRTWLAGGLICAMAISGYVTAGTATHWRPGWRLTASAGLYPARPVLPTVPGR